MKKKEWESAIDTSLHIIRQNREFQSLWVDFMGYGYFPKQLPPPFQTINFAQEVNDDQEILIDILKKTLWPNSSKSSMKTAQMYRYSYARPRQLRRILALPNPAHYILLSLELAANWPKLSNVSNSSSISLSKPTRPLKLIKNFGHESTTSREEDEDHRLQAVEFSNAWDDLAEEKLNCRAGARYIAKADIARFFSTVYTHTIPWVFHGKDCAKKNRSDYTLLGNRLDTLIRSAQDGQTLGIPIGPDSSYLLSECILAKVDDTLQKKLKGYNYKAIRMVDDYEFACFDRTTAEKCLSILQETLLEYELELNNLKSEVIELPQPIQPAEFLQLRTFVLHEPDLKSAEINKEHRIIIRNYKTQLLNFIDLAFQAYANGKIKGVFKFAIKKIKPVSITRDINVNFMCHCMLIEPGSIETVLQKVAKLNLWTDRQISLAFANCFSQIIKEHSELGHASEVAWALWGYILFKITIPQEVTEAVSTMNDSVVLLLALDACQKRLMKPTLIMQKVKNYLSADQLYGEQWLLAYEVARKGWTLQKRDINYLNSEVFFKTLKSKGIEFYNSRAISEYRHIMEYWEPNSIYNEGI